MIDYVVGPEDDFSEKFAEYVGAPYAQIYRRVFPDKELCPRIKAEDGQFSGKRVVLVSRTSGGEGFHPNGYLMELLLVANKLRDDGAKIDLFLPYLPYARQDKVFRPGEVFSAKYLFDMFKAAGVGRIFTITAHMQREEGRLKFADGVEAWNVDAFTEIGSYIKEKLALENPFVIGPDLTAAGGAEIVTRVLGAEDMMAIVKERDRQLGEIKTTGSLPDLTGRPAVIVDDLAATGGTIVKAAEMCKSKGASQVVAAVVHPVLAGDCLNSVRSTGAKFLACNTLETSISKIHIERKAAEFIKSR
jgi:ribose-phosphate pyrophosphokinase